MSDPQGERRRLQELEQEALREANEQRRQAASQPFLMPVEEWGQVPGHGGFARGLIARGILSVGDQVEILGIAEPHPVSVTSIEILRKRVNSASTGDVATVFLHGMTPGDKVTGHVLAKPASLRSYSRFTASVYMHTKDEGGRHTPFFPGYAPRFFFHGYETTGTVTMPDGVEMVAPGETVTLSVELLNLVAMEVGTRFVVREGQRTVGSGTVVSVVA
jgi:elongation factor Tu